MQSNRPITSSQETIVDIVEEIAEKTTEEVTKAAEETRDQVIEASATVENTATEETAEVNVLQQAAEQVQEILNKAEEPAIEAVKTQEAATENTKVAEAKITPVFTFNEVRDAFFNMLQEELKHKTSQKNQNDPDKWISLDQLSNPRKDQYKKYFDYIELLNARRDINEVQRANAAYQAMLNFQIEISKEYKWTSPMNSFTYRTLNTVLKLGEKKISDIDSEFLTKVKADFDAVADRLKIEAEKKVEASIERGAKISPEKMQALQDAHLPKILQIRTQQAMLKEKALKEWKSSAWTKTFKTPKTDETHNVVVNGDVNVKNDITERRMKK